MDHHNHKVPSPDHPSSVLTSIADRYTEDQFLDIVQKRHPNVSNKTHTENLVADSIVKETIHAAAVMSESSKEYHSSFRPQKKQHRTENSHQDASSLEGNPTIKRKDCDYEEENQRYDDDGDNEEVTTLEDDRKQDNFLQECGSAAYAGLSQLSAPSSSPSTMNRASSHHLTSTSSSSSGCISEQSLSSGSGGGALGNSTIGNRTTTGGPRTPESMVMGVIIHEHRTGERGSGFRDASRSFQSSGGTTTELLAPTTVRPTNATTTTTTVANRRGGANPHSRLGNEATHGDSSTTDKHPRIVEELQKQENEKLLQETLNNIRSCDSTLRSMISLLHLKDVEKLLLMEDLTSPNAAVGDRFDHLVKRESQNLQANLQRIHKALNDSKKDSGSYRFIRGVI